MPRRFGFLDPLETRQFPGSSGYWATSGTNATPNTSLNGMTYPGDAARKRFEVADPWPTRYNPTGRVGGGGGAQDPRFTPISVEKFPGAGYNDAITRLNADLQKAGSAMPDFTKTLSSITSANSDIPGAFDRYSRDIDPTDYINTQRGLYPQFDALTGRYADTARGIGTRYQAGNEAYARSAGDIVDRNMANAERFRDVDIDAAIQDALAQGRAHDKLYDIAEPGGRSSAGAARSGREAVRATLPFRLQANQAVGDAIRFGLGPAADIASRNAALQQFNLGNESNIYGAQQADVARRAATEGKIREIETQTAGLNLDAALRKSPALVAGAMALAQVRGLTFDDILKQAQTVKGLLDLMGQANYTGVELNGGANITDPMYFNNIGIPSRYQPGAAATATGTNPGAGAATGGNAALNAAYAQSPQYRSRFAAGAPVLGDYGPPSPPWMGDYGPPITGAGSDFWLKTLGMVP